MRAGVSQAPGMHGGSFLPSSSYKCSPQGAVGGRGLVSMKIRTFGNVSSICLAAHLNNQAILTIDFHSVDLRIFQKSTIKN